MKKKFFAEIGKNSKIQENVIIGLKYKEKCKKAKIGNNAIIRAGTIIYADVVIGNFFVTGHNVLIRENTNIGNNVLVGTNSIVENNCKIGNNVSIQSNAYIPTNTTIEDFVFIGPNAVLTNDKYPVRTRNRNLIGPTIKKGATIGANSTILPGIEIGVGSFVAAGAVVTKDVPDWHLAVGNPAKIKKLPKKLREINRIKVKR